MDEMMPVRVGIQAFGIDFWVTAAEWEWIVSGRAVMEGGFDPIGARCPWPRMSVAEVGAQLDNLLTGEPAYATP